MNDIFLTKSFGIIIFIHQSDHEKLVQYLSLPFSRFCSWCHGPRPSAWGGPAWRSSGWTSLGWCWVRLGARRSWVSQGAAAQPCLFTSQCTDLVCACSVSPVPTAHDRTPFPAGGGTPCWKWVSVSQLVLEVILGDLLAHGQPQGVLQVVVVGPGDSLTC